MTLPLLGKILMMQWWVSRWDVPNNMSNAKLSTMTKHARTWKSPLQLKEIHDASYFSSLHLAQHGICHSIDFNDVPDFVEGSHYSPCLVLHLCWVSSSILSRLSATYWKMFWQARSAFRRNKSRFEDHHHTVPTWHMVQQALVTVLFISLSDQYYSCSWNSFL